MSKASGWKQKAYISIIGADSKTAVREFCRCERN